MKIPFIDSEILTLNLPRPETRMAKQPRPGPWEDFWYQPREFESSTGIDIDDSKAMTYFAVWACRKIISEDIGSIPLFVYRRDGEAKSGSKLIVKVHKIIE